MTAHIRRPTRADPQFLIFGADVDRVLLTRRKTAEGAAAAARQLERGQPQIGNFSERHFRCAA